MAAPNKRKSLRVQLARATSARTKIFDQELSLIVCKSVQLLKKTKKDLSFVNWTKFDSRDQSVGTVKTTVSAGC